MMRMGHWVSALFADNFGALGIRFEVGHYTIVPMKVLGAAQLCLFESYLGVLLGSWPNCGRAAFLVCSLVQT